MNNTKWNEIFQVFYNSSHIVKWRTKDKENGFMSDWDASWSHFGCEPREWDMIDYLQIELTLKNISPFDSMSCYKTGNAHFLAKPECNIGTIPCFWHLSAQLMEPDKSTNTPTAILGISSGAILLLLQLELLSR